ncbi:BTB/POZ protein [Rhizophagus irregularis DAOM 181602=DAOM 197198]|nr:BTB/POZ protein [Rhizophagus irregularis DAOM 181602=DAOM 197198]
MSTELFSRLLSQNYIELLEDNEYYDITIEVGEDPNVKIFRAHMNILCYRSSYLRRTLTSNKKNDNGVLSHIKLPNISPEIFQIVLRYIYGGILSLNGQETSDILNVLVAADELHLQELVNYLQKYLIENNSEWLEQHFELIHQTSFQSKSLSELQEFCTNLMAESPEKIFQSFDFTSLPEKSLVSLLRRDDLQMKEIEVFCCLSSIEFSRKIRPYKKLLSHQLYEGLLNSYLDPDRVSTDNSLLPRNFNAIVSKVENIDHALNYHPKHGPYFGQDIVIWNENQFADYKIIRCKKNIYKKKIRDSEDYFSIEDYEVFQIIKR